MQNKVSLLTKQLIILWFYVNECINLKSSFLIQIHTTNTKYWNHWWRLFSLFCVTILSISSGAASFASWVLAAICLVRLSPTERCSSTWSSWTSLRSGLLIKLFTTLFSLSLLLLPLWSRLWDLSYQTDFIWSIWILLYYGVHSNLLIQSFTS